MYSESMLSLFGQIKSLHHLIHEGCESFDVVYSAVQQNEVDLPSEFTADLKEASHLYASVLQELSGCIQEFTTLVTSPVSLKEAPDGFSELLLLSGKVLGRVVVTLRHMEDIAIEEELERLSREIRLRISEMNLVHKLASSLREEALVPSVTFDA